MQAERIDVVRLVTSALAKARAKDLGPAEPGILHRARSTAFVEALGQHLRDHLAPDVRVLTRQHDAYRRDFGVNELLFDVLAFECASADSERADGGLWFVTRGLWAVESEFARDTREALHDFNKLVLADCESKLFVAPHVRDEPELLRVLSAAAARCNGAVYLALVPHPDEWGSNHPTPVSAFRFDKVWVAIDQST